LATPAVANFPLISTNGGLPGEKNRSLMFGELFNITVSKAAVEAGAGAGATAAALPAAGFTGEAIEGP
jgi:hypothetical protein